MGLLRRNLGGGIEGEACFVGKSGRETEREREGSTHLFILRQERIPQASPSCEPLPARNKKGCLSLMNHKHKHRS